MPIPINEININKGNTLVNVFIGRCQPPSKTHYKIINLMLRNHKECHIFLVHGLKTEQSKNPFDSDIQENILKYMYGDKIKIHNINNGFMGEFINILRNENLEPINWYCGSDNEKSYRNQLIKYKDTLKLSLRLRVKQRADNVSSTRIRKCLETNDIKTFKTLVCKKISNKYWFDELQKYMKQE
jgi:hypothetical protein